MISDHYLRFIKASAAASAGGDFIEASYDDLGLTPEIGKSMDAYAVGCIDADGGASGSHELSKQPNVFIENDRQNERVVIVSTNDFNWAAGDMFVVLLVGGNVPVTTTNSGSGYWT